MEKIVEIENRGGHDGVATGGHYGFWAEIIVSRPEIVNIQIVKEEHKYKPGKLNYHYDYVVVKLMWNPENLSPQDYIIIHHRHSPGFTRGGVRREFYELVAGTMPSWASFPCLWKKWVEKIRDEAIGYIFSLAAKLHDQELTELIECACRKTAKNKMYRAWSKIQKYLEKRRLLKYQPEHGTSWTAIKAMPIKIAKAAGWKPSIPQPVWEPKGGIIIASPKIPGYILQIKNKNGNKENY